MDALIIGELTNVVSAGNDKLPFAALVAMIEDTCESICIRESTKRLKANRSVPFAVT